MTQKKKGRVARSARTSRATPSARSINALVEELVGAADRCALASGNANWTDGYRAAKGRELRNAPTEQERLDDKSRRQWQYVENAYADFRSIAHRILREARKQIARNTVRRLPLGDKR